MLVPDSEACGNQFSSTTPIPAARTAARIAQMGVVDSAVAQGNAAAQNLFVANPWESWIGGLNLMRDIVRGNTQVSGGSSGPPQLPGVPPASSGWNLRDWLAGKRGNARGTRRTGWQSRFVTGPGGKFQNWTPADQVIDCQVEAADVVPSDGIVSPGTPEPNVSTPPAGPSLTTNQAANIIVQPPPAYGCPAPQPTGNLCADVRSGVVLASTVSPAQLYQCSQAGYVGVFAPPKCAGMGEWSDSLAKPGAVPADCASGASTTAAGPAGMPWWLWALAGVFVVVAAQGGGRSSGTTRHKRAA